MRSLIALLFLFPFFLIGQESSDSLEEDEYEYIEYISFEKYGIGITPSALVNIYGGIQISQDFGLSENLNISLETAYLYNLSFNKPASGFRIKPGIQYMFWSEGITGLAIGINANYRNTTTTRLFRRIYWQENFEETRRVKRNRELIGGDAMFSFFFRLSDALRLEFGLAAGLANVTVEDDQVLEPEFRLIRDDIQSFVEVNQEGLTPYGGIHINLSYDLVFW